MSTRDLVDPEIAPMIDLMPSEPLTLEALPGLRETGDARFAGFPLPVLPPERVNIGAGDLTALVFNPPGNIRARPAVLHIHGGGMVMGTATMCNWTWGAYAKEGDFVVVSVEYRVAPETPFPGPLDDCAAGLDWLVANAESLGVDPSRIALAGESAGGGLAAALALKLRDTGGFKPCAQILTYPMLDHRTGGPDDVYRNETVGEFVWTRQRNQFGWEALRGDYALDDQSIGWFSPSRARDLSRLPRAYIATGSLDLFFDEDVDYARRLCAAGVEVELHSYPGAIHGFQFNREARLTREATANLQAAIARLLA